MRRLEYISTILADLGEIFLLVAPVTALPLLVALIFSEWDMLLPMAAVPAVLFLTGMVLKRLPRSRQSGRLSTAMCTVALFWLACAIISGIPFMLGLHMGFLDSVFEGMAGWTGTAFSMIRSPDTAPYTLLFWRSFMQWVGGIGIIAFTVALTSSTGLSYTKFFRTDSREESLVPSVAAAGRALWKIYGVLTFCAIGLILFTGLSLWESVNLALSAISTGGFTLHEQGLLYYDNAMLVLLLIPIMIAGALPFRLYFLILEHRRWSLFGDEQVKLFFLFLGVGTAILAYDLMFFSNLDLIPALGQALFMAVSALTSTGFQVISIRSWAGVTILVLAMLTFIGGSAGSTAGGIKIERIAIAIRALIWWFRRLYVSGKVLVPFRIGGRVIPKATAELETAKNMLVILLSVITIFVASLAVIQYHITTYSLTEIVFQVVSAFSTCGINTGYVSPDMPASSKWIFIVVMWIGRLEVIPVVMLFLALFRRPE
jgi:trk system potassium uptake protein TrkH